MNRRIKLLILSIMVLYVTGCVNQSIVYSDEYVPWQDSQYWYVSYSKLPMADTEDGYYFFSGEDNKFLYFRDKVSGEVVPFCNKPECLHLDDTCNAYLLGAKRLLYYSEKLYYLRDGFFNPDRSGRDTLFEISTNGCDRKELIAFSEYVYQIAIHRGYVYYITTDFGTISGNEEASQTLMNFYRIPVKRINSKPELLYTIQGIYANTSALLCYGNFVYFTQSFYPEASMDQAKRQMNRYSIKDNSIDVLPGYGGGQYTVIDGKIAFTLPDGTYLCDMDGQNVKKIWDQYGPLLSGNQYLLIDTLFEPDVKHRKTPRTINAFDKEGNFMESIDLNEFRQIPIGVVDDNFLVPYYNKDTHIMTIYSIPVEKIADGTGMPEVFFEYTPEE